MPVALHYNTIQTGAVSAFLEDNESGNESIRLIFFFFFLLHICYTPVHLKKKQQNKTRNWSTHQIKMLQLRAK